MSEINLRVRDRSKNGPPRIYARYTRAGLEVECPVGLGWIVPVKHSDAKPRGKTIKGWVDRRRRAPEGLLTIDAAWRAVPAAMAAHNEKLARREAKARAEAEAEAVERVTLAEGVERWLIARKVDDPEGRWRGWKRSHAKNMTNYANRMVSDLGPDEPVSSFETPELRRWLAEDLKPMRNGKVLDQPTSRKQRSTYAGVLAGFFGFATLRGWISEDPTVDLPGYRVRRKRADDPLRREEYLTKTELRAALDELKAGRPPGRTGRPRSAQDCFQDMVMVLVMAMVGLRPGEAAALTWAQIDFAARSIRIVEGRTMGYTDVPKSGSGRTSPLPADVAHELRRLRHRGYRTGPKELVFVGRDGAHVDLGALGSRFDEAQDRAGISPFRDLRQMRNTFGTICAAGGVPIRTIQQWLGHASITTTEIYTPFMPRDEDASLIDLAFAASPRAIQAFSSCGVALERPRGQPSLPTCRTREGSEVALGADDVARRVDLNGRTAQGVPNHFRWRVSSFARPNSETHHGSISILI
jgi:integrase